MNLYGVFTVPTDGTRDRWRWGMTWNKRNAITEAKKVNGTVRVLRDPAPENRVYDAPTFHVLSDKLWPLETAAK